MQGKDEDLAKTYRLGPARRAVNVLVTAMLRLGVAAKSTYLLTTTGRNTGRPRTTPMILVEANGECWLVAPYGLVAWVHNVRARPEVSLRRGRTTHVLHAEEVDSETAGSGLAAPCQPSAGDGSLLRRQGRPPGAGIRRRSAASSGVQTD
jgi:deazaflavin-dependent oxidoreductase (nitroreductase family)